jgi:hypothetical protein
VGRLTIPPDFGDLWDCLTIKVPHSELWRAAVKGALSPLMYSYSWDESGDYRAAKAIGQKIVMSFSYENACDCNDPVNGTEAQKRLSIQLARLQDSIDRANVKLDALAAQFDGTPESLHLPSSVPSVTVAQWCVGWEYYVAQTLKDIRTALLNLGEDALVAGGEAAALPALGPSAWTITGIGNALALPAGEGTLALAPVVGEGTALALPATAMIAPAAAAILGIIGAFAILDILYALNDEACAVEIACNISTYMKGKRLNKANVIAAWQYASEHATGGALIAPARGIVALLGKLWEGFDQNWFMTLVAMSGALRLQEELAQSLCQCPDGGTDVYNFETGAHDWIPVNANGHDYATLLSEGWIGWVNNVNGDYCQLQIALPSYGKNVKKVRINMATGGTITGIVWLTVSNSFSVDASSTAPVSNVYEFPVNHSMDSLRLIVNTNTNQQNVLVRRIEVDYE